MSVLRKIQVANRNLARGLRIGLHRELGFLEWAIHTRFGNRPPNYQQSVVTSEIDLQDYSKSMFTRYSPAERVQYLLYFLASMPNQTKSKLLVIGPRYTNEIILARGLGWKVSDIFAIDALSYSKKVYQGDAHSMPFPSSFFASIVVGWVMPYSKSPRQLFAEVNRVLEPRGVVIFGADTCTPEGAVTPHNLQFFSSGLSDYRVIGSTSWHQNSDCIWVALQKPGRA